MGNQVLKPAVYKTSEYLKLQEKLAVGWNTWDTQNTFSFVKLPKCFSFTVGIKSASITKEQYLPNGFPSLKFESDGVKITPGGHAYDGSYTEQQFTWNGTDVKIESATFNDELLLLITPLHITDNKFFLYIQGGVLWNRSGTIVRKPDSLVAKSGESVVELFSTHEINDIYLPLKTPYLSFNFNSEIGFSTGDNLDLQDIKKIIGDSRKEYLAIIKQQGKKKDVYEPMQKVLAWNTIYDPSINRVITPVSRVWNYFFGSYVLFCWDTYFASLMFSYDNKEMAYANAVEITKSKTPSGFVPNYITAHHASYDRSQPPVGSIIVKRIFDKYQDTWFLDEVYDDLFEWNRWWLKSRFKEGYLCWGSDATGFAKADPAENSHLGAMYECGLDNSPMYSGVPFNKKTHLLELADVGLISLYITDCKALAYLAKKMGKPDDRELLLQTAREITVVLSKLWDEERGTYLNYRTDTKQSSEVISPTSLYPLLTNEIPQEHAEKMIRNYYFNPDVFWGDFVIPSISKENPEFSKQVYWKGRIWAPMNFLVYLGMLNYNLPEARADMVEKSKKLFLNNWESENSVFENYRATGEGRNKTEPLNNSDSFYHWGALLGYMSLID